MIKAKYSFMIICPTEDVDPNGQEQMRVTLALHDIESLRGIRLPQMRSAEWTDTERQNDTDRGYFEFPSRVIDLFKATEQAGELRVEILEGAAIFKMYIAPEQTQ
jgi:hypothetical protein